MGLRVMGDDSGQINIDFLFGFGVFLIVFIYIATFIPGLFVPFQPGAIDLSSVAYRTSAILVEDPGWYTYTINDKKLGASSWENHSLVDLARVGLASNRSTPNVISIYKVEALDDLMKTDYAKAREKMGLSSSVIYDVNLTLNMTNTLADTPPQTLIAPSCPNATAQNVETIRRNVMVDTGKVLFVDSGASLAEPAQDSFLRVNITNNETRNYNPIIRIYNVSGVSYLQDVRIRDKNSGFWSSLTQDDDYYVLFNGNLIHYLPPVSGGNIIEIVIKKEKLQDTSKDGIGVVADSSIFAGRDVIYEKDPLYKLKNVLYPGVLRLDVWIYEYA